MKKRMLRFSVEQENGIFVARCIDIDVVSDGKTEAEAIANLEEALALYGEEEGWEPLLKLQGTEEIAPVHQPVDLLAGITEENRHEAVDWGPRVGREII
jgi:predicted RNase H-like HicB family nuclease